MNRLIDADALEKRMYHDSFETDNGMQRWDSGLWIRYKMFAKALEEAPTVEPEQKNGRWYDAGSLSCRCSACGCKSQVESLFCPNCGAKMEG